MLALESARMRLSVAIAEEMKSMSRDRWLYYLDIAEQVRALIKKIRIADCRSVPDSHPWIKAIEKLDSLPVLSRVSRLHEILRDIEMELE